MSTRYTLREKLQVLRTRPGMTYAAIGDLVGASARTVRRWFAEGSTPSTALIDAVRAISTESRKARREIKRHSENYTDRDKTRKIDIVKPIKPQVGRFIVPAMRRKLRDKMTGYKRRKVRDKKTGKYKKVDREIWTYKLSDYIMYDVRVLNQKEQSQFVRALLQDGNSVQLVFRTDTYGARAQYMTTSPLNPELVRGMSDADILKHLKLSSADGFARSITGKASRIIATPTAPKGRHHH